MAFDIPPFIGTLIEGHSEQDPNTGLLTLYNTSGEKLTDVATMDANGNPVISPEAFKKIREKYPSPPSSKISDENLAYIANRPKPATPGLEGIPSNLTGTQIPQKLEQEAKIMGMPQGINVTSPPIISTPNLSLGEVPSVGQFTTAKQDADEAARQQAARPNPATIANTSKVPIHLIDVGLKDEIAGINLQKDAAIKRAAADQQAHELYTIDLQNQAQTEKDAQKAYNDKFNAALTDYNKSADDLAKTDVKSYWADKSIFTKIFASLMVGLGEGVRIKTGGTVNMADQIINQAIDQDMAVQKLNLEKKKDEVNNKFNVFNIVKGQADTIAQQNQLVRGLYLDTLSIQLAKNADEVAGTSLEGKFREMSGKMKQESYELKAKVAKDQAAADADEARAKGQKGMDNKTADWFNSYNDALGDIEALKNLFVVGEGGKLAIPSTLRKKALAVSSMLKGSLTKAQELSPRMAKLLTDIEVGDVHAFTYNPSEVLDEIKLGLHRRAQNRILSGVAGTTTSEQSGEYSNDQGRN